MVKTLACAVITVVFATGLIGCGGGGGGSDGSAPVLNKAITEQLVQQTLQTASLTLAGPGGSDLNRAVQRGSRATLAIGCPTVTDNRLSVSDPLPNPWIVTGTYNNCVDDYGDRMNGSLSFTLGALTTSAGYLVGGTCAVTVNNLRNVTYNETIDGTAAIVFGPTSYTEIIDLSFQDNSGKERIQANWSVAWSNLHDELTLSGSQTYIDSMGRLFTVTLNSMVFDTTVATTVGTDTYACIYPYGGRMTISYGGETAIVDFVGCTGTATVTQGGATYTIAMN